MLVGDLVLVFCHFNGLPSCMKSYCFTVSKAKKNTVVFAANNSPCCKCLVGADCMLQENSRRYMTIVTRTIISCKYHYILLLGQRNVDGFKQDGGLIKGEKNAYHHTLIQSSKC
jgi:hypothetical protein